MSLIAKTKSISEISEFVQVPIGMHLARCYRIVDLGTQPKQTKFGLKHQRTIMLNFEVHGDGPDNKPMLTPSGDPLSISADYNLSLNENSKLSKDLQGWRGAVFSEAERNGGFDIKRILGAWAMINVTSSESKTNGKIYHNIDGLMPVPKMIKDSGLPAGSNPLGFFSMEDDKPDMKVFESVSQYHQNKIRSSPEWAVITETQTHQQDDDMDDDIPF